MRKTCALVLVAAVFLGCDREEKFDFAASAPRDDLSPDALTQQYPELFIMYTRAQEQAEMCDLPSKLASKGTDVEISVGEFETGMKEMCSVARVAARNASLLKDAAALGKRMPSALFVFDAVDRSTKHKEEVGPFLSLQECVARETEYGKVGWVATTENCRRWVPASEKPEPPTQGFTE